MNPEEGPEELDVSAQDSKEGQPISISAALLAVFPTKEAAEAIFDRLPSDWAELGRSMMAEFLDKGVTVNSAQVEPVVYTPANGTDATTIYPFYPR